jgi:hypothetical protein
MVYIIDITNEYVYDLLHNRYYMLDVIYIYLDLSIYGTPIDSIYVHIIDIIFHGFVFGSIHQSW